MTKLKHAIIKEVMVLCEFELDECVRAESYTPRKHQTIEVSLEQARKDGWCIRKGKTCCPDCKNKL